MNRVSFRGKNTDVAKPGGGPNPKLNEDDAKVGELESDDAPQVPTGIQDASHNPPRMVRRNLPFYQSRNRFAVRRNYGMRMWILLRYDWFHILLNAPTFRSLFLLLSLWTGMILLFAGVYMGVDRQDVNVACGLGKVGDPISFEAAFAFSLETCTTVGYGLPSGTDAFFENCGGLQAAIFVQMLWSIIFNAFLFAFFYSRLAKADSRAHQVLFSKQAVVSLNEDQVRFQFRVYDLDASHPVVEAHVRLYVLTRDQPVPKYLRLIQPNDELGGRLLLSMPSVVTHHIDVYSTLHPPVENLAIKSSGLVLREVDSIINSRDDHICPLCGESYGSFERWVNHIKYNQIIEAADGCSPEWSHLSIPKEALEKPNVPITDIARLRDYFKEEISEVVCVVEGIDPLTSGTFTALHSYCFDEIAWDPWMHFRPCLNVDGERIQVDLDRFHETIRLPNTLAAKETYRTKGRLRQFSWRLQDTFADPGLDNAV